MSISRFAPKFAGITSVAHQLRVRETVVIEIAFAGIFAIGETVNTLQVFGLADRTIHRRWW